MGEREERRGVLNVACPRHHAWEGELLSHMNNWFVYLSSFLSQSKPQNEECMKC